jgi:hypothetical protein
MNKMELNDREWKDFPLGGKYGVFNIISTSSGIDKNKLVLKINDGKIPYITRTELNNGINLFIHKKQQPKYQMNMGNVLTIGLDTQTVFYQPHKFFTGQNIQILNQNQLNKYNSLFIIPLIKIQMKKFNWGGNGATLGRLAKTKLILPIDIDNKPDWAFMEEYIKEKYAIKEKTYKEHIKKVIKELTYKEIVPLEEKEWKEFFLTDLFQIIGRGKRLIKSNQIKGHIPYISSTCLNNGIDNYISNDKNIRKFSNCITIANSGSVGASFYQPFEFVASDHITHLKNECLNEYIYLFIVTLTGRLSEKYNFNREINDKRISREKIMLPVTENNEPDYQYMEQYIKNIMIKKYNEYLRYRAPERTKY